jgi:hypothetical protein
LVLFDSSVRAPRPHENLRQNPRLRLAVVQIKARAKPESLQWKRLGAAASRICVYRRPSVILVLLFFGAPAENLVGNERYVFIVVQIGGGRAGPEGFSQDRGQEVMDPSGKLT